MVLETTILIVGPFEPSGFRFDRRANGASPLPGAGNCIIKSLNKSTFNQVASQLCNVDLNIAVGIGGKARFYNQHWSSRMRRAPRWTRALWKAMACFLMGAFIVGRILFGSSLLFNSRLCHVVRMKRRQRQGLHCGLRDSAPGRKVVLPWTRQTISRFWHCLFLFISTGTWHVRPQSHSMNHSDLRLWPTPASQCRSWGGWGRV